MGRDAVKRLSALSHNDFNPLSPHGERPVSASMRSNRAWLFQSTLPAWGETWPVHCFPYSTAFQSTLPAWGETFIIWGKIRPLTDFNPLSPHGERRPSAATLPFRLAISIHSPRMGRDISRTSSARSTVYFNPLSPHGERPPASGHWSRAGYFNPLSPHGERRISARGSGMAKRFQSTLPAWGETKLRPLRGNQRSNFNPLSPHGERLGDCFQFVDFHNNFNPLSPHGERQCWQNHWHTSHAYFNPLSPHGERQERGGAGV